MVLALIIHYKQKASDDFCTSRLTCTTALYCLICAGRKSRSIRQCKQLYMERGTQKHSTGFVFYILDFFTLCFLSVQSSVNNTDDFFCFLSNTQIVRNHQNGIAHIIQFLKQLQYILPCFGIQCAGRFICQ